jgi:hypothetical protein
VLQCSLPLAVSLSGQILASGLSVLPSLTWGTPGLTAIGADVSNAFVEAPPLAAPFYVSIRNTT